MFLCMKYRLFDNGAANVMVADNVLTIGENVATLCLSIKPNIPPIARSTFSLVMSLNMPWLVPFFTVPHSMSSGL